MARILFLQPQQYAYPGLYYICGALKKTTHHYRVLATNRLDNVIRGIREFKPDVVGFPCLTGLHREILHLAEQIKQEFPDCKVLLGGIHPTLYPQIIINPSVDFICRGEGERPTCELLDALDGAVENFDIPNITWKKDGVIHSNDMRQLADPLDSLPFPDYAIYRECPPIANDTYPTVFMTRGCPFSCTYCHNSNQRKVYRGKGHYVRSFSTERILAEVESVIHNYPKARAVFLGADTLGTDMVWLTELLTSYHARFTLPYTCLVRPEFVTEELAALLGRTNCHMIAFGIESGSQRVRRELLHRNYSDEQIINAAGMLRKYGIKFRTYNVIGLPSETPDEMLATLELNLKIKPDFPWCSIFTPYPGTKLADFAIAQGYLDPAFSYDDVPLSFFNDTILNNVERDFILNLHALFQLIVLCPSLYPLLKPLLKRPNTRLFKYIFKIVYAYTCIKSEKRGLVSFLRLAMANRKLFR